MLQRSVAATTIVLVLNLFEGFACLKAFWVARVRYEFLRRRKKRIQAFSEMRTALGCNVERSTPNEHAG
jgi:hypothetical protein